MEDLQKEKIDLVGGCFDILHVGHIRFLQKARALGDKLIILLESDKRIKEMKGEARPINSQKDRAEVLTALEDVDSVILLPSVMSNNDYDEIVKQIKPTFIATTKGDSNVEYKKRAATLVNAKVKFVTPKIGDYSTSKTIEKLR